MQNSIHPAFDVEADETIFAEAAMEFYHDSNNQSEADFVLGAASSNKFPKRIVINRQFKHKKLLPLEYLIDNHLRAGIPAALISPGGVGKTWLAIGLGMSLASSRANKLLLNLPISKEGGCLYLCAEDDEQELEHRLQAATKVLPDDVADEIQDRFHAIPLAGEGVTLASPKWIKYIKDAASEIEGLRLIMLDTLNIWTPSIEENDNTELAKVVETLKEIIKDTSTEGNPVTILMLHHPKGEAYNSAMKISADDPFMHEIMAPRGASVIKSNCRWVGWLTEMSPGDAKIYGISEEDRSDYVAFGRGKGNGGRRPRVHWMKRNQDGVLIAAPEIGSLSDSRKKKPVTVNASTRGVVGNGVVVDPLGDTVLVAPVMDRQIAPSKNGSTERWE